MARIGTTHASTENHAVRRAALAAVAGLAACGVLQAQTPPDAGRLQRQTEQGLGLPVAPAAPPAGATRPEIDRAGRPLTVRRFVIEGASLIPAEELAAQLAAWRERPVTLGELQEATQALVRTYRERGWYARVQIPPQDASDGTLRIRVVEGRFGRLRSEAPPGTRANVRSMEQLVGRRLAPGQPYSQEALERGLLLANDLPGVSVDGLLQAGAQSGTSDLVLRIADQPLFSGHAAINNTGSRFTGRVQASAQLSLDNPGGRGDQATASLLASERLRYAALGYAVPVGSDGLRARAGITTLRYRLGDSFAALQAEGRSQSATLALSYPLLRTGTHSAWIGVDASHGRYEDETLGLLQRDRRVATLALSAWGNAVDDVGGGGASDWRVALVPGKVRLGVDAAQDAAGARTAGGFARLTVDLRRDQRLGEGFYLRARFSGQVANGNLDSSQKFGLGGAYGVRGYPGDDGQGDAGALLQLELHRPLAGGLDGFVFVDGGRVRQHQDPWPGWDTRASGNNSYGLAAAGIGLNWNHAAGWQASLVLAQPLGNNPGSGVAGRNQDGGRTRARAWLTVAYRF
jgi:hemolysin activation/secretion protein